MKRIALAIAAVAVATSALATPPKQKCEAMCQPTEEVDMLDQTTTMDAMWLEASEPTLEEATDPVTGKKTTK